MEQPIIKKTDDVNRVVGFVATLFDVVVPFGLSRAAQIFCEGVEYGDQQAEPAAPLNCSLAISQIGAHFLSPCRPCLAAVA
jgi:hypothetical protein